MRTKLKKIIISIVHILYRALRVPLKIYWKIFNIQTQGVRVILVQDKKVLLVRHWYQSLWVMPGGGIKKNETPEQAAIREVQEESGIIVKQLTYKLGVYSNTKGGKNDVVHCFVCEDIEDAQKNIQKKFNLEISDCVWCSLNSLPESCSVATRNRIEEFLLKNISNQIRPWN